MAGTGPGMMNFLVRLRALDSLPRHLLAAGFLGWTLDAFDFFLLTAACTGACAIRSDDPYGRSYHDQFSARIRA